MIGSRAKGPDLWAVLDTVGDENPDFEGEVDK